jgi:hypothetical protein
MRALDGTQETKDINGVKGEKAIEIDLEKSSKKEISLK